MNRNFNLGDEVWILVENATKKVKIISINITYEEQMYMFAKHTFPKTPTYEVSNFLHPEFTTDGLPKIHYTSFNRDEFEIFETEEQLIQLTNDNIFVSSKDCYKNELKYKLRELKLKRILK